MLIHFYHIIVHDIVHAFMLLTRISLFGKPPTLKTRSAAHAVWVYPIVGAVLGACAGFIGVYAVYCGLPPYVSAVLVIATLILCTGALHEDGLADTCDGLWGGHNPQQRYDIMHDSRIGVYGALALILSVLLRHQAIVSVFNHSPYAVVTALVVVCGLSRAALGIGLAFVPNVQHSKSASYVGVCPKPIALLAILIAFALAYALLGLTMGISILGLSMIAACLFVLWFGYRKIGGKNGDILGASQQTSEIVGLLVLVLIL